MSNGITRREFLKTGATVGAGISLMAAASSARAQNSVSPNEKIVLGIIGVAGRGTALMDWFRRHPDVEIGAVCDVYKRHLDAALQRLGGKAKGYSDFRKLLEQKDIDAVIIATPPHWHPLIFIYACQAGKDVYCEKPMCLYPAEARAMVKAARENNRVTQIGTQIHAEENYHRVVEIVRSGILGKITAVRNVFTLNEAPKGIGRHPDSDPPEGLDWDMWLGPAPKVPFNMARFVAGQHRYFKDYVGSWLHEMGPHIVDLPVWALELGPPKAVFATGGKWAMDDMSEIPDTMEAVFEYPDMLMTWHHMCANSYEVEFKGGPPFGRRICVLFHGLNGSLAADYGQYRLIPEGDRLKEDNLPPKTLPRSPGHEREFLDCIKSRKQPSCSVFYHYNVHIALNLAHISMKVGRKVLWDDKAGRIINDEEANRLVTPRYRAPWKLPV